MAGKTVDVTVISGAVEIRQETGQKSPDGNPQYERSTRSYYPGSPNGADLSLPEAQAQSLLEAGVVERLSGRRRGGAAADDKTE